MKAYKDKQFLIFEFEDDKSVKYNLATNECIGFSGKIVKNVCSQLRGLSIPQVINLFEDVNYKNFLKFIENDINPSDRWGKTCTITNVGTFLSRIKKYSHYEQIFSSGICYVGKINKYKISEIPKGLIKLCRIYPDVKINDCLIKTYLDTPNLVQYMFNVESDEIKRKTLIDLITCDYTYSAYKGVDRYYQNYKIAFYELLNTYNYNVKSLINYIEYLHRYEGLDNTRDIIIELRDYARMSSGISKKYEKYPKNLLTTHRIVSRNYTRLKTAYSEELFKNRIDKNLEFSYKDYKTIYPNTTQEIKDEAIALQHCVAGYIGSVIDGKCHIMFLRHKNALDVSLITLEVIDGKIVQARGLYNRATNAFEQEVIDKFNKNMGRELKKCC